MNIIYDELTNESLTAVMDTIKNEEKKYNNCIIFDDVTASLKNPDVKKLLKQLVFNRRHLSCSIIFLVQSWLSVEKDIRKLFSNIFCFRVSKNELQNIFDEVVESKSKYINDISKMVFDEKYKYLFINVPSQRLFDGFDEILIEE
jgi:tyrosyl-tRNA synthetase